MKLSFVIHGGLLIARSSVAAFQMRPKFGAAFSRAVDSSSSPSSSTSLSLMDIREDAPRDLEPLDQWALDCEIQRAEGWRLTSEDGEDISVMTDAPLEGGTPILYVPANCIMSSESAKTELWDGAHEAAEQLSRLGAADQIPQFYLFVKVLAEWEKGENSPWFPWMNSLPRRFYNAVSMTSFCYECLPPLVFSLARKERVKFDNFFSALRDVTCLRAETKRNEELAQWAFNVVYTRGWGPNEGGNKCIVPMADLFNHGTDTEVEITVDEGGNCVAYTTHDVPEGSPLRVSYGDPTNPSHLFATYGFLDETSPATFCKIMTIVPNQELLNLGYDFSRMLFYKDTGEISEEVWDVMLYQQLADNRPLQQAFHQAHVDGDAETKNAIHSEYFLETTTALKQHVDTFLENLEELSAKGDGKSVEDHPRLPLIMRHNAFVRQTFLNVKAQLDPMVEQAAAEREPALA